MNNHIQMSSAFMKRLIPSSETQSRYECTLCNCNVVNFSQHEKTQKHISNLERVNTNVFITDISILKNQLIETNEEMAKIKCMSSKQDEAIKRHQETIDKQYETIEKFQDTIEKQDETIEQQDETIEQQRLEILALKGKIANIVKSANVYKDMIDKLDRTVEETKFELFKKLAASM